MNDIEQFTERLLMGALIAMHAHIQSGYTSREQLAEMSVKDAAAVLREVDRCVDVSVKKGESTQERFSR